MIPNMLLHSITLLRWATLGLVLGSSRVIAKVLNVGCECIAVIKVFDPLVTLGQLDSRRLARGFAHDDDGIG